MHCFVDKNNTKWSIELNVGTAKRVLAETNVDLINVLDFDEKKQEQNVLEKLSDDPCLLVDVLYCLCREQAKELGVDDFAFASLFTGETIIQATDALLEEIISFSPPVKQKVLKKIYETSKSITGKMETEVGNLLNDPKFTEQLEEEFMKLSTTVQASLE